jgi:S-adenosylmethionine hydrolase
VITLLTDFGARDAFVGIMKGVILSRVGTVQLVDLCHGLAQGDRLGAAFQLRGALPFFPPETVHVVVVDPGVGTTRAILAVRLREQFLIVPDNGIVTPLLDGTEEVRAVDLARFALPSVSRTFHGRDVFAPAAAALAWGTSFADLGPVVEPGRDPALWPAPHAEPGALRGEVLHVDRFGNLISNLPGERVDPGSRVFLGDREIGPLRGSYSEVAPGSPLAILDSFELLEVAVRDGSAAEQLRAARGTPVTCRLPRDRDAGGRPVQNR